MDKVPSLSGKESVILDILIDSGNREKYGLEMVSESGGRLKPGTIYVTLSRMEDKGFVESRQEAQRKEAIGPPRRLYKVTGLGMRVHAARQFVERGIMPEVG